MTWYVLKTFTFRSHIFAFSGRQEKWWIRWSSERIPRNKAVNWDLWLICICICTCISYSYFVFCFHIGILYLYLYLYLYCNVQGFKKESPATKLSTWRSDCCIDHKSIAKAVPLNEIWWKTILIFSTQWNLPQPCKFFLDWMEPNQLICIWISTIWFQKT